VHALAIVWLVCLYYKGYINFNVKK
jgi:hypothetical protein